MSLTNQIDKEYIEAYKARENVRVGVLRLLKTAMKNRLVELERPGGELSDEEVLNVIIRQAKQRRDSIEQYNAANRPDLAAKEEEELRVLNSYLPKSLSPEELDAAIDEAIRVVNARDMRDMGKVMNFIMSAHKGAADGKVLSQAVKKRLSTNK